MVPTGSMAADPPDRSLEQRARGRARTDALLRAASVLVLDDQPANVELLRRVLTRAGCGKVTTLTDPLAFETAARVVDPDLVIVDLHMPGRDGFDILAAVRDLGLGSYVPVLMLTGDPMSDTRERALAAGAQDFLTKPFDANEVVLRCVNLIETRFLYRRLADHNLRLRSEVVERTRSLERAETARAGIVSAIDHLTGTRTFDEHAATICADLAARSGFDMAVLIGLPGRTGATVISAAGPFDVPPPGLALGRGTARYLREHAAGGPWTDTWSDSPEFGDHRSETLAIGLTGMVLAPLLDGEVPVAILAGGVTSEVGPGDLDGLVPIVVEHAAIARALLLPRLAERLRDADVRAELEAVLRDGAFEPYVQPIVDLASGRVVGFEGLTRFRDGGRPDVRFETAASVGLGLQLELATVRAILAAVPTLPADDFLSVNVSPEFLRSGSVARRLLRSADRPLMVEITEHRPIDDYRALRASIRRLGPDIRLAIDDAGAGYASFRHVLELRPSMVKVDMGLIRGIDRDPSRQALVAGMRYFADRTDCELVAEGIETEAESAMVRALGITLGQGFLLGPPRPVGVAGSSPDA